MVLHFFIQLSFLKILHDLVTSGNSQIIIATHSPILLRYQNATIYSFDHGTIQEIDYEMTDHYQITKYSRKVFTRNFR